MKKYISQNKATILSLGFAAGFMSIVTAASILLSEVSPAAIF